jgi:hypothetical protein
MATSVLYGVLQEKDLDPNTPAVQIDRDLLIHATQMTLAEHNAEINAYGRLWHGETTERQLKFEASTSNELQPGDEYTDPKPVKGAGSFDTYFPISHWYTAWAVTEVTAEQMTLQDVSNRMSQMLQGDATTYRKAVLSALFTRTAYTAEDANGTLTISGLANGDSVTYLSNSSDAPTTADMFSAEADAIADNADPYLTMSAKLKARPRNVGPYVAFIPSANKAATIALDAFRQQPSSLVNDPNAVTINLPAGVVLPPSSTILGVHETADMVIVEYPRLPDNYLLAGALGGPPPLLRRQYPQASLQGFRPSANEADHFPFRKQRWARRFGFGGWNRTGWAVHRVGSDTYAPPTGYDKPLGK